MCNYFPANLSASTSRNPQQQQHYRADYYRTLIGSLMPDNGQHGPESGQTGTKPSPAPIQKHSRGVCTVHTLPSNYHRRRRGISFRRAVLCLISFFLKMLHSLNREISVCINATGCIPFYFRERHTVAVFRRHSASVHTLLSPS